MTVKEYGQLRFGRSRSNYPVAEYLFDSFCHFLKSLIMEIVVVPFWIVVMTVGTINSRQQPTA